MHVKVTELELSYLAALVPKGLEDCEQRTLRDIYFPASAKHAKLRIRQKDESYELTKKTCMDSSDAGIQQEENIALSAQEFEALAQGNGREVAKTRYLYPYEGRIGEIDVFSGRLRGLVMIDFEFESIEDKDAFEKPDFCLVDVTQEDFVAGGMLAGKAYEDIAAELQSLGYKPLYV